MTSDKYAYVVILILIVSVFLLGVEAYQCVKALLP